MDKRLAAANIIGRVLGGESLSRALPIGLEPVENAERAVTQALVYGVFRYFEALDFKLSRLLERPMKSKDAVIRHLLLVGIFELEEKRTASHAVVNELVKLAKKKRSWAGGLVNACLRRYQREEAELALLVAADEQASALLPQWLLSRFSRDWPDAVEKMKLALAEPPPMTLRVNLKRISREAWCRQLKELGHEATVHPMVESAVVLAKPLDVSVLPGFHEGLVSVQDAAAQLSGWLVAAEPGMRVLDACAAPGGKMAHLLEMADGNLSLVAVEYDAARSERLNATLARTGYQAGIKIADAGLPATWWDGGQFDRILLDAPCSATGTVRRNPDIKRHRRTDDIVALVAQQQRLLMALWPLLKPGGRLVYATCSVIKEENADQISRFIGSCGDAEIEPLKVPWGRESGGGRQILPGDYGMDGFYYASLKKN